MAEADACNAGTTACGDLHCRSSRTGPGRRRQEPQGSDKSPGRVAPAPPPSAPRLGARVRSRMPGTCRKGPLGHPPRQAHLQPPRTRTGLPGGERPQRRRPAAGLWGSAFLRAAALPCKRNTRERRVKQRPQGVGEERRGEALTSWWLGSAAVPGGAGPFGLSPQPSAPLRLSGGARACAWARGRAGEVTAALGPRARAAVFVKGRTGAGKGN